MSDLTRSVVLANKLSNDVCEESQDELKVDLIPDSPTSSSMEKLL